MLKLLIHESVRILNLFTRQHVMLSLEIQKSFPSLEFNKGSKYIYPDHIDFNRCRKEIASALFIINDFGNRWCKRESVECIALNEWKISISNIVVDKRIKFHLHSTS